MTGRNAIQRLKEISPEDWDALDALLRELDADAREAPSAVGRAWAKPQAVDREKAGRVLAGLDELAIRAWIEAAEAGGDPHGNPAWSEAVNSYLRLQQALVAKLQPLLQSKEPVPVPPPELPTEEAELSGRECDHAYCCLRRLLQPDESEFTAELTRRLFLRMTEAERDAEIEHNRRTGNFSRLTDPGADC
jgi:hypothetical protein